MKKSTLGVAPGIKHRKRTMNSGRLVEFAAARQLHIITCPNEQAKDKVTLTVSKAIWKSLYNHVLAVTPAAAVRGLPAPHPTIVKDAEVPIDQAQVEAALAELSARVDDLSCLLNQTADEAAAANRRIEAKLAKTHAGFRESRRDLERLQQAMKAY